MVLTRRAAVLALLGAAVVAGLVSAGLPAVASLLVVDAAVAALLVADAARAARPTDLSLARSGDRKVRLAETASVPLTATHTGTRRWRGHVRDAWVPTAGAHVRDAQRRDGRPDTVQSTPFPPLDGEG